MKIKRDLLEIKKILQRNDRKHEIFLKNLRKV